jgi:hypothetical protein
MVFLGSEESVRLMRFKAQGRRVFIGRERRVCVN